MHQRETGPRNLGSTIDGRRGKYIYLKYNSAAIGGCPQGCTSLIRSNLPSCHASPAKWFDNAPTTDPTESILARIATGKVEQAAICQADEPSMRRSGELTEMTQAKLERELTPQA